MNYRCEFRSLNPRKEKNNTARKSGGITGNSPILSLSAFLFCNNLIDIRSPFLTALTPYQCKNYFLVKLKFLSSSSHILNIWPSQTFLPTNNVLMLGQEPAVLILNAESTVGAEDTPNVKVFWTCRVSWVSNLSITNMENADKALLYRICITCW